MKLRHPFDDWLADVVADPLIISDDVTTEALGNVWSFSLGMAAAQTLTAADVALFLETIIEARREQILNLKPSRPMLYYCWFDEQSGRLRFSLVTQNPTQSLPFSCKISLVDDLQIICTQFLESKYLDGIPLEELQEVDITEAFDDLKVPEYCLSVFAIQLP